MELFCKAYPGEGEPLVILHGLFGNQANWAPQARELARSCNVFVMDLRNHGRSPWHAEHTYPAMAADVLETLDNLGLQKTQLMGHSMGGKVAMQLALENPQRVSKLVLVDIAPVAYAEEAFKPLEGLLSIDLETLQSRRQADEILAARVEEKPVREFLLTNLQRDSSGKFSWRFNLSVLAQTYDTVKNKPEAQGSFEGPTLFIKGGKSSYLLPEHRTQIKARFPHAGLKVIEQAGHWVHSEKPQAFVKLVGDFLAEK